MPKVDNVKQKRKKRQQKQKESVIGITRQLPISGIEEEVVIPALNSIQISKISTDILNESNFEHCWICK